MSFSSDLWNVFDLLKNTFLKTFNKIKNFYEIMFSLASIEKNYTINLEILYDQYKTLFNTEEIFFMPSKTFISNIKVECEYHKMYYNNIFENVLSPLKEVIESKKKLIIKNFLDNNSNTEKYEKLIHNLISNQENYHNSCKELALCISDINIYTMNLESKKRQNINKGLLSKRDSALEKVFRTQIDYLNILTESNIVLKDYNTKTENILNNLESEMINIGEKIKTCLINYNENKIQLFNDVFEILNQSKNNCYEKINIKNDIKNFVMKNATKEFKYQKFEYIPFKINNINKALLFSDKNENKKNQINYEQVIELVKKYFVDNKITQNDSEYITKTMNSLKKYSIEFNIKYEKILEGQYKEEQKCDDNKNLISDILSPSDNKNNIKNNSKTKEIMENNKYLDNFINKLLMGDENLDKEIIKVKSLLEKKENLIYVEQIIDNINNFRKKGNYILSDKTYNYFVNLFNLILDIFNINDNVLKNIIIYSQTFYKIKDGETYPKIFILNSVIQNSIFNQKETWHKIINHSLNSEIRDKYLTKIMDKNEKEKALNENAFKIIAENLAIMELFMVSNETYNEVKNYYINVYKIENEILDKEIKKLLNDNDFVVNKENENHIIKGVNIKILINDTNKGNKNDEIEISKELKDNGNNTIEENKNK